MSSFCGISASPAAARSHTRTVLSKLPETASRVFSDDPFFALAAIEALKAANITTSSGANNVGFAASTTGVYFGFVAVWSARVGLGLSELALTHIRHAAPLHDVGKIAIPDSILLKPGRLSAAEFEVVKTHAEAGARAIVLADHQAVEEQPLTYFALIRIDLVST